MHVETAQHRSSVLFTYLFYFILFIYLFISVKILFQFNLAKAYFRQSHIVLLNSIDCHLTECLIQFDVEAYLNDEIDSPWGFLSGREHKRLDDQNTTKEDNFSHLCVSNFARFPRGILIF